MGNSGCFLCLWGAPSMLGRWCWSPLFPGPGSGGWHLLLKEGRRGLSAVMEECLFCWILLIKADFGQGKEVNTVSSLQPMLWEASSLQKVRLSTMPFLWKAGTPAAQNPTPGWWSIVHQAKIRKGETRGYSYPPQILWKCSQPELKAQSSVWQEMEGWGFRGDSELLGSSTLSLQLLLPIPLFLILFVDSSLGPPGGHHRLFLAWADSHILQWHCIPLMIAFCAALTPLFSCSSSLCLFLNLYSNYVIKNGHG